MTASSLRRWTASLVCCGVACAAPVHAQRPPIEAPNAMVVSVHELATQAGVDILKKGGNAIDAAVATGLALVSVYPWAGSLGGGGFMLVRLADGRTVAIDFRETAPASATRDMYLGPDKNVLQGASTTGWRASGIPGNVAGFAHALEKYGSGKVTWSDVCEAARKLADDGHVISAHTVARLRLKQTFLGQFPETKKIFLKGGELWKAGERWRQPELAATFARLQQNGPREFYEGETAQKIAAAMAVNGGTITLADLKNYRPVERVPVRSTYRGHEIVSMPPPSSGGIALLQMLAMLEPFEVAKLGHNSAAKHHLFVEAMRRAYRVRAEYLGDPDFVKIPVPALLDRTYAASLMKTFDSDRATPSNAIVLPALPGAAGGASGSDKTRLFYHPLFSESSETTHFSVIDAAGNAVATTYTINGGYGSGVTIPGTGILMNNEMDDFTSKVGVPNLYKLIQGEANAIVPGKRPLSSMTPTLVLKNGKPLLITGSPGGATIMTTVLQVITNVIDFGMPVSQAVEAPRVHHQWMPDAINHEPFGLAADTAERLRAKGHEISTRDLYAAPGEASPIYEHYIGDAESILIDPVTNVRHGASDPRKPDSKAIGF